VFLICFRAAYPVLFGQSRPPVILIEAGDCSTGSRLSFGNLESLLNAQGIRTIHFSSLFGAARSNGTQNATLQEVENPRPVIDQVADPQVDLGGFSMGGPVVRWLSLRQATNPRRIYASGEHKVRKVVFIAAGFFGGPESDPNSDISVRALEYGSRLQWDLATGNQHHDDIRQVDAVSARRRREGGFGWCPYDNLLLAPFCLPW